MHLTVLQSSGCVWSRRWHTPGWPRCTTPRMSRSARRQVALLMLLMLLPCRPASPPAPASARSCSLWCLKFWQSSGCSQRSTHLSPLSSAPPPPGHSSRPSLLQPFNSPEEAIAEPTLQQIRDGIAREMCVFNPELRQAAPR